MTDIVACHTCQSTKGFRVEGTRLFCKTCGDEHQDRAIQPVGEWGNPSKIRGLNSSSNYTGTSSQKG